MFIYLFGTGLACFREASMIHVLLVLYIQYVLKVDWWLCLGKWVAVHLGYVPVVWLGTGTPT